MNPSVLQNQLHIFAQQLQRELTDIPQYASLGIRSAIKQNILMILIQHPPDVSVDAYQTFSTLEHVLQHQPWDELKDWLGDAQKFTVRLYLRVLGQRQAYDSRQFTVEPLESLPESLPLPFTNPLSEELTLDQSGSELAESDQSESERAETRAELETREEAEHEAEASEEFLALYSATSETTDDPASTLELTETQTLEASNRRFRLPPIPTHLVPAAVLSTAMGLFVLVGGIFALTRPCVLGRCVQLETAQQLSIQSMQRIQTTSSADEVLDAYDQLVEASYLLGTIPPWSSHHRSAQHLLVDYEAETTALERVVAALHKGNEAAQSSQNPPHPLPEWQTVKDLWQQAIALLQNVPTDSPVYPLAQRKLKEYQQNLAVTNQRLTLEQKAQQEVVKARSIAQLAETQEGIAMALADWKLAYETWQTAVNQLRQVPDTTMAYAEAQQLLDIYQAKLAKVGDRHTQEEIAQTAYTQAIALAEQAQTSEADNQWSQAVDAWRDAVTHIQQIPQGTSYAAQAQTMASSYQTSLTSAQEHLRIAMAMQLVASDLERACSGISPVCSYALVDKVVRLTIMPEYVQTVKQSMVYAQPEAGTSFDVIARSNYLLRAIASISEAAQLPIELYDSNGRIFGKYDPDLSGYVQQ